MRPLLKNDSPIKKNHLTTRNGNILQTKRNIQRKYRIGTYSNTNSNTEIARKTA